VDKGIAVANRLAWLIGAIFALAPFVYGLAQLICWL
jgi:hypothetical protein